MKYALNKNNKYIPASSSIIHAGQLFYCPACHCEVTYTIRKSGATFTHKGSCKCTNYKEPSEWQLRIQEKIRPDLCNIYVPYGDSFMIADCMIGSSIIMFMNDTVTEASFNKFNSVFSLNYRVIWICDYAWDAMIGKMSLEYTDGDSTYLYWKWAPRIFKSFLPQYNKDILLYITRPSKTTETIIARVNWVAKKTDNQSDFSHISISNSSICSLITLLESLGAATT